MAAIRHLPIIVIHHVIPGLFVLFYVIKERLLSIFSRNRRYKDPDKITRLPSSLNVGTMVFGLILIYIIITLILYLTQKRIAGYEVVEGTISGNYRYSAIALKEEEIINSDVSGNITYYAREGAKANVDMVICSVGGTDSQSGDSKGTTVTDLSDEDLSEAKNELYTFAVNFNDNMFSEVYSFKADMQGVILQSTINDNAGEYVRGSYKAPYPGFVVYATDGMEGLTAENLTSDCFNIGSYQSKNLRLNTSVSAGDPIYKLITNDVWNLCFPVDDALKRDLEDISTIRIRFLKDNSTFSAPIEMVEGEDGTYGKITLNTSLVRFVKDRYLEIELILSHAKGLKIPVTSITEKTFVQIPEEYVTVNEDTASEVFLIRESFLADGSSSTSNVTASVYSYDAEGGYYLVDPNLFEEGDYVVMPGTTKKYQITSDCFKTIQGVYNINKGYAVFRQVNILDENEEFCIIDPTNIYGLAAHDRIVLDASKVKDDDIIKG